MPDVSARVNQSVRRGATSVYGLAIVVAIAWIAILGGDLISTWETKPFRALFLIAMPLLVVGSLVRRARASSRFEFTPEGIRVRSTRQFALRWPDVLQYDFDRHALLLYLRDGRIHEVDLYVVSNPSVVRHDVLSLVPEAAHRGAPA